MRVDRNLWLVGVVVLLALGATSCTSAADDPVDGDSRTAAVYESILDWVLEEERPSATGDRPEWILFVAARSPEQIDLDVQVAVVDALDPSITVRFIDEGSEAVAEDIVNAPVNDDGILVGLGAVAQAGDTVEVYVDRYRNANDVEAWLIEVHRSVDGWQLVGTPVPTDVRSLPTDT